MSQYITCVRKTLKEWLENSDIPCKVPLFDFTEFNSSKLKFCSSYDETRDVEQTAYDLITRIYQERHSGLFCRFDAHYSFCIESCGFYAICSGLDMICHTYKMMLNGQIWHLFSIFGNFLIKFAPSKRWFVGKFDVL